MGRIEITPIYAGILVITLLSATVNGAITNGVDKDCTYHDEDMFKFELCKDVPNTYFCSLSPSNQDWFKELYTIAMASRNKSSIIKRREIRTLSEEERHAFFNAVNALKMDTSVEPNMYDAFANVHFNRTLCSVHKGSNFLGWHRIYILLFETALRLKDESVTLPYWGSTIEANSFLEPKRSIIFTDSFLGNGDGYVTTGPFGHWRDAYGCPIERNVASMGAQLMSTAEISLIENNDKLISICDVIDDDVLSVHRSTTIEYQHNVLHNWVGGMMGVLDAAPRDPAFYLHHAYIDYIWEKFREKQKRTGHDPEVEYPDLGDETYNLRRLHVANRTMDCFPWMSNKDGYRNIYTESIYTYEDLPSCPDCKSRYLTCYPFLNICEPVYGLETVGHEHSNALRYTRL